MSLKFDDARCFINPDRICPIFSTDTEDAPPCPMAVCHVDTSDYACGLAFLASTVGHQYRISLAVPAKRHKKERNIKKGVTRLIRFKD